MAAEPNWDTAARALGYPGEQAMLIDFYNRGMSLKDISKVVGFSSWSVRRHLLMHGVSMRRRGGPHHLGKSKLAAAGLEELFTSPIVDLVLKYDVHAATVTNERNRRKAEYAELLRNRTNKDSSVATDSVEPSLGASSEPENRS